MRAPDRQIDRFGDPALMATKERRNLITPLPIDERAGGVDQQAAGPHQRRREIKDARLFGDQSVQARRGQPPARLRIAPPCAGS